jgi:hypothetical protein
LPLACVAVDSHERGVDRNGPAAPHGLPALILAFSQFSVRIRNENTCTLAAACGSLA